MKKFSGILYGEFIKMMRSPVFWVSCCVVSIMPLMMGFMMFVLKHPETAANMGLITAKADISGMTPDWPSFLSIFTQGFAGMETVIFGFIAAWVFGREYTDRTLKDILALPVSRYSLAAGKFAVFIVWGYILFCVAFMLMLVSGNITGLAQWDAPLVKASLERLLMCTMLTLLLNFVTAFAACVTRGVLAAVAFIVLAAVTINFANVLGFGDVYPWSIPMGYASIPLSGGDINPAGIIIVAVTGIAGAAGTFLWWRYADQF